MSIRYRDLYHSVQTVFEDTVGLLYLVQRETMCNERCGINLPFRNKAEYLLT